MERLNRRLLVGVLLILVGVLVFLQNLQIFQVEGLVWGGLFVLGGLVFLWVLIENRTHNWWAAIPGVILVDLGLLILLPGIIPGFEGRFGGAFFLAGISAAFWLVYLLTPANWWAVIPGGVLLTLAAVAGIDSGGIETGGIFFLGLAATFGLLSLIPVEGRRMTWPLIPAGILAVMGVLFMTAAGGLAQYVWPALLILAGLFLLARGFVRR